jgi:hypothetical protein
MSSRLPVARPMQGAEHERGQGMIEYLVATSLVALVLFLPNPLTDNMALADYLARAVRTFFRGYSFLLSVT